MYSTKLILQNFRNYPFKEISFSSANNLFIGENGVGKTNLLEALYLLSTTKSFRKVLDIDLVNNGKDGYFIEGLYEDIKSPSFSISLGFYNGKKQIKYNANVLERLSDIIGKVRTVTFLQEDINLILGSPSLRRRYLDLSLSLSYPSYFSDLKRYNAVLKQRNNALKKIAKGQFKKSFLSTWNAQLLEYGTLILKMRHEFFEPINLIIGDLYSRLKFDITGFSLSYKSSIGSLDSGSIADIFSRALLANEEREILYKQSLFGPHKDDFLIQSEGIDFSRFASQGQTRACALTLKLAMTYYMESIVNKKSILLLDDVVLDLDEKKKDNFFTLIDSRQSFFTSTSLYGFSSIENAAKVFNLPL